MNVGMGHYQAPFSAEVGRLGGVERDPKGRLRAPSGAGRVGPWQREVISRRIVHLEALRDELQARDVPVRLVGPASGPVLCVTSEGRCLPVLAVHECGGAWSYLIGRSLVPVALRTEIVDRLSRKAAR